MSTIHNSAKKEDISKLVLLTGDPLRAKLFSEKFLESPRLVNSVRGMFAFTGKYKGIEITIMGHGMGLGSMGIYSYELFDPKIYDVEFIIRLGSCGTLMQKNLLNSVVVVESSHTFSCYGELLGVSEKVINTDENLIKIVEESAKSINLPISKTKTLTTDSFYTKKTTDELHKETACETIEMESFALMVNAKVHNKLALTILTIADSNDKSNVHKKSEKVEELTYIEREQKLTNMFLIGAETLLNYSKKQK